MKKLGLFLLVFGLSVVWARSFPLKGVEYKDISAEEFFQLDLSSLKSATGYKVSDVYVVEKLNYYVDYVGYIYHVKVSKNDKEDKRLDASDFIRDIMQKDSTFINRFHNSLYSIYGDKYNGHYTFWLYCKRGDVIVTNIEGVPTQEQLDADKSAYEAEKLAKWKAEEEAEKKAKAEKRKALDDKARALAKGYVFHGIDEAEQNCKYFVAGALEDGHAYYIPWFVVSSTGSKGAVAYDAAFLFRKRSSYVWVEYASLKVKADVIDEGFSFGERLLDVVVIGGKAPLHTPVVLGLVK